MDEAQNNIIQCDCLKLSNHLCQPVDTPSAEPYNLLLFSLQQQRIPEAPAGGDTLRRSCAISFFISILFSGLWRTERRGVPRSHCPSPHTSSIHSHQHGGRSAPNKRWARTPVPITAVCCVWRHRSLPALRSADLRGLQGFLQEDCAERLQVRVSCRQSMPSGQETAQSLPVLPLPEVPRCGHGQGSGAHWLAKGPQGQAPLETQVASRISSQPSCLSDHSSGAGPRGHNSWSCEPWLLTGQLILSL
jgi:hypothetical protein